MTAPQSPTHKELDPRFVSDALEFLSHWSSEPVEGITGLIASIAPAVVADDATYLTERAFERLAAPFVQAEEAKRLAEALKITIPRAFEDTQNPSHAFDRLVETLEAALNQNRFSILGAGKPKQDVVNEMIALINQHAGREILSSLSPTVPVTLASGPRPKVLRPGEM